MDAFAVSLSVLFCRFLGNGAPDAAAGEEAKGVTHTMQHETQAESGKELQSDIGLVSALSLVVGMVLGAGAFMKPPAVLAAAGDSTWALAAWAIGGLFSIAGGLTLCELGVLFPRTGGVFVFLEALYGPKVAFLYGWMLTLLFGPGTIGALTGYFSSVFCLLFDIPAVYAGVVGAAVLAFVTFINCIGVKEAGYLQAVATFCKLIPIILLTIFGLWKGNGQVLFMATGSSVSGPFSVAILATLFAYDGWAQVAAVAGEMKNPGKVLPQAIIGGLSFLIIVYLAINVALLKVLPPEQMIALGHDASSIAAQKLFGLAGGNIIAVGIMISILGGLNGYVMTLSRIIYTMGARNQMLGSQLWRKIDADSKAPVNAMLLLVVLSYLYYRLLDADRLSDVAMFAVWIFYGLAFAGVFIARRTHKDAPRSYRVPFYPVVPLIAIGGACYVIYGMLCNQPVNGFLAIGLTLAGLPVYYYQRRLEQGASGVPLRTKSIVGLASLLTLGLLWGSVQVFDTRPEIKVAVEPSMPPFVYQEANGSLSGFDVELLDRLAQHAGVKVTYRATLLEHIFEAVQNGYADAAIGSLSVTPERQEMVAFTKPYIADGGLVRLTPRQGPGGRPIGVLQGSTAATYAAAQGETVRAFRSHSDMLQALQGGELSAVISDRLLLAAWQHQLPDAGWQVTVLKPESYALVVAKQNKDLQEKFNKALQDMEKSGELAALKAKWLQP